MTPTTKNSAIVLVASKEFLDGYFFHYNPGPKEVFHGKVLEDVLDKFEILSLPNIWNMISSFRSCCKGGIIDSMTTMKRHSAIECIHGNIFLSKERKSSTSSRCWRIDLEAV